MEKESREVAEISVVSDKAVILHSMHIARYGENSFSIHEVEWEKEDKYYNNLDDYFLMVKVTDILQTEPLSKTIFYKSFNGEDTTRHEIERRELFLNLTESVEDKRKVELRNSPLHSGLSFLLHTHIEVALSIKNGDYKMGRGEEVYNQRLQVVKNTLSSAKEPSWIITRTFNDFALLIEKTKDEIGADSFMMSDDLFTKMVIKDLYNLVDMSRDITIQTKAMLGISEYDPKERQIVDVKKKVSYKVKY